MFPANQKIDTHSLLSETDWQNWKWQLANSVKSPSQLDVDILAPEQAAKVQAAAARHPVAITPYYLSLSDHRDPCDPIMKMAFPSPLELSESSNLRDDPLDDEKHSPIPGLIHRYPDRAVLLVAGSCAVYCRHCTRRRLGRQGLAPLDLKDIERACIYLTENRGIRDVILSGGDPLLLDDDRITEILMKVTAVTSIEITRIGTRTPVTLPMRITDNLVQALSRFKPLYINTQFNHPREVTKESSKAVARLVDAGIPVANQTVLLADINDRPDTIEELCRALLRIRVRPYYLFLCDLWSGIDHLRTTVEKAIAISEHLRGRLSGLGIPQLVADLPGGVGKVPVGRSYIVSSCGGRTVFRAPDGSLAAYPDPVVAKR